MKKHLARILLVIALSSPIYSIACGTECKDGVCSEVACGDKCICGCKKKFYQEWQFWAIVGTIAVVLAVSNRHKFEHVNSSR